MPSNMQKNAKELIIYSALVAEFERLDFKEDALAGVRANYFNGKCAPQTEKTEIIMGGKTHSLSCSMQHGMPLSWKISCENLPVQTVRRASDGSYSVMSYGANGVIFKRQYFDANHLWLRTEYFDRALENRIAAVLYPKQTDGLTVLRLQRFMPSGIESRDLFPSFQAPKKRCAALVYSDSGMVWFDERFKTANKQAAQPSGRQEPQQGFRFAKEAFLSENVRDVLHLGEAAYLSDSDLPLREETPAPVIAPEPEPAPAPVSEPKPGTYSVYDQIESILMEAHKTNKNIFGELANYSEKMEKQAIEEQPAEEAASAPAEEPTELSADEAADVADVQPAEEALPDSVIPTKNGAYAYFGSLDADNRRTGRGRTVTPDGLTAYDGEYRADKRDGFGVCYYKEGSPNYVGDWKAGDREGRGVGFRLSDGTLHAGKWSANKPDGFGARFDRDGNFLDVCTYVGGIRNGKSVSFDEDGNVVVRMWRNGELVSEKIISD